MSLNLISKLARCCEHPVHNQSALVNGLSCGKNGKIVCEELFPDALWMESENFIQEIASYKQAKNASPKMIFCKNNGVIIAGATEKENGEIEKKLLPS